MEKGVCRAGPENPVGKVRHRPFCRAFTRQFKSKQSLGRESGLHVPSKASLTAYRFTGNTGRDIL